MATFDATQPARRCAVYTRKSVQQDPTHQFGSLEAQRSICSSYIASQKPKGWVELPRHYDDDGQSGGDLRRPALQELLSDIESGLVDVVVIYKLDRITRTLLDFVRLMDLMDQFGVGFVAVTQNFDTSDSTGRLILNILLTFAQFEREIASDRLKDKFGAMRQRGMFVGGNPPYGYNLVDKKLLINAEEGDVVRWMFERYLTAESYVTVAQELRERGVVRRSRTSKRGNHVQGRGICIASVWNMLGNPLYVGDVRSKGTCYPGMHEGIVSRALWDEVQALRAKRTRAKVVQRYRTDLLRDLMFDSFGRKMGVFRDHRYAEVARYYISNQSEWGRRHGARRFRTKADPLERLVIASIASLLSDRERTRALLLKLGIHDTRLNKLTASGANAAKLLETASPRQLQCAIKVLIERIELSSTLIKILVRVPELPAVLSWDGLMLLRGDVEAWGRPHVTEVMDIPASTLSLKRELTLLMKRRTEAPSAKPNRRLVGLLQKARSAQVVLDERSLWNVNEMAAKIHCHPKRFTRLVRLNYLAPDIIASIRDGTQPPALKCQTLMSADLPMDWTLQRRLLGFADQPDFLKAAPGW
jgi:DNA invertase Pin-like site-specific DNA recombinase